MSSTRVRAARPLALVFAATSMWAACLDEDDVWDADADRSACLARPPGSGSIVVHYSAHHEKDPPLAFLDALAGKPEQVIVTRALAPSCTHGAFAHWRGKGERFRWAFKVPATQAVNELDADNFAQFVREKIDAGWDYVAIDEINANPNAPISWMNGSQNSKRLVAALEELSATGYGRRVMPYFAASTVSNPDRSKQISHILAAVPKHTRIGMLELYRKTSDAHTVEQHRAYFHDKARNFEMAVPGINHHIIAVLGVINKDEHNFTYLDVASDDLASLTRQFAALHQANSLTRRHPGVGAYSWGAIRHRHPHYSMCELAEHFRKLSDWYAAHFGVDAPGNDADDSPALPEPPESPEPLVCNEPDEADVDGVCVPSCGAAGGNTCLAPGQHACDPYGLLTAYDCAVCCTRPEVLTVYRGYDAERRTHKYGLSEHDVNGDGYQIEGPTFGIARDAGAERRPLLQCRKHNGRLLYTTLEDCEGMGTLQGALGYIDMESGHGMRPLHRLYHSGNGAHLYVASDAELEIALTLNYAYEGIMGYVW